MRLKEEGGIQVGEVAVVQDQVQLGAVTVVEDLAVALIVVEV